MKKHQYNENNENQTSRNKRNSITHSRQHHSVKGRVPGGPGEKTTKKNLRTVATSEKPPILEILSGQETKPTTTNRRLMRPKYNLIQATSPETVESLENLKTRTEVTSKFRLGFNDSHFLPDTMQSWLILPSIRLVTMNQLRIWLIVDNDFVSFILFVKIHSSHLSTKDRAPFVVLSLSHLLSHHRLTSLSSSASSPSRFITPYWTSSVATFLFITFKSLLNWMMSWFAWIRECSSFRIGNW